LSTNDNHFDNHFKAISIHTEKHSLRDVKTRAIEAELEVPETIKEIVHVE
jgi:hypothetical protein